MLVLSRNVGEKITVRVPASSVEQLIEVVIVTTRGERVRVGLEADKCVKIHRQEVFEAIQKENSVEQ